MCKAFPLLMTVLLVAFAGCSYQDFRRPPLRNYAADLRYKPLRPAEGAAPEIERVDLAEALARWRQMEGPVEETYAVGPGDVLRVSLFGQGQVGGNVVMEVPVTETGRISCPLVGEVQVAGLDTARIKQKLTELYSDGYYRTPLVTVVVSEYRSKQFFLAGAVARPGVITLRANRIRLLEALLLAGGLTQEASGVALVTRSGPQGQPTNEGPRQAASRESVQTEEDEPVQTTDEESVQGEGVESTQAEAEEPGLEAIQVDLRGLLMERSDIAYDLWIQPGDTVYVPQAARPGYFYIFGFVNAPGAFQLPPDEPIGIIDAIGFARGLSGSARSEYTYLRRTTPGGQEVRRVDLTKVAAGKEPDVLVLRGDTIIVGTSWPIRVLDGILRAIGLGRFVPSSY